MSKRMLIDGTHPEETRVVVTSGKRLDEYDVESSTKRQLKGNIYLAKVTRVEPSLQAAFVDYGGNRHGFLAFNEIHPDYYQIPVADREALMREQAELDMVATAAQAHVDEMDGGVSDTADRDDDSGPEDDETLAADDALEDAETADENQDDATEETREADSGDAEEQAAAGGDRRRNRAMRRYKIQEVIKRRQILLVQVVKEERGNKGAALTTYISLAGRYCVLMPNTGRGGGISRKITSATARRKLRDILGDLEIPQGMGVIMRTAGMERSKTEIKRDFEYLLRAWDTIRELTLESTAPTLIYEEGNLIKRAIRDLYSKDIDEILIEGNDAYQTAKKFMRMLMPSHAKRVQPYRDEAIPLFHRYQVESQLDDMLDPVVQLKSGGYIVIHTTEALVAIDVNSGRSTRERNIEETALKTNIEAADEVARQLRLRDLAGLVVIDFIDMEIPRNPRKVERVLKDAMAVDRARIQIGRISSFGLLELSRQRLRPSLQETSTEICPHCEGVGYIRSTESMAVRVLRALEEEGIRKRSSVVMVKVPTQVALYILNKKRFALLEIEQRYDFDVTIEGDNTLPASEYSLERIRTRSPQETVGRDVVINMEAVAREADAEELAEAEADAEADLAAQADLADEDGEATQKRPRRRRRSRKDEAESVDVEAVEEATPEAGAAAAGEEEDGGARRRRRGKRGGRRRSRRGGASSTPHEDAIAATFAWAKRDAEAKLAAESGDMVAVAAEAEAEAEDGAPEGEAAPQPEKKAARKPRTRTRRKRRTKAEIEAAATEAHEAAIKETFAWAPNGDGAADGAPTAADAPSGDIVVATENEQPAENAAKNGALRNGEQVEAAQDTAPEPAEIAVAEEIAVVEPEAVPPEAVGDKPKRRGWWQRMTE